MKRFSFSDAGIFLVNDINYCKHFPFVIKEQAVNILEKVNAK